MAQAGGFELQTLDTSMMYAGGNTGSISIADINASVRGTVLRLTPLRINASRILVSKWMLVSLIWGRTVYRSGAIQLSGGNDMTNNYAPTGDIDINSTTLMASYDPNENISFLGGITQNSFTSGNVTTIKGSYDVKGASSTGCV